MDVKTGPTGVQPVWERFAHQAAEIGQALSDSLAQTVDSLSSRADAFWQEHTAAPARQPATVLPLVDPPAAAVPAAPPRITAGTKVLIIGDSQTVGPYGHTLDALVRATGATVATHASWGASPPWFFNQTETYKYWTRDDAGQEATRQQVPTPNLNQLLAAEKPDVVVVTMGGNMIAANAAQADVTLQVSQIGNAVSASGAQLVWVGPPKYDPQRRSPELVETFYQKLRNIVPEYGTLIDSRPYISEYAGTDGLHYSGAKGETIARQWAQGVFGEIQQLK